MAPKERMLSFGVEMEFYIFWRLTNADPTARPRGFESHPGTPFVVDEVFSRYVLMQYLKERIQGLFTGAPEGTVLSVNEKKNVNNDTDSGRD